jgi:uncharacterized protein YaaR (DUF327 family)
MKTTRNGLIAIAALLLVPGTSLPQEQGAPSKQQQGSGMETQHGQAMPMDSMMQKCHKNMQSMMQSNDQLKKTIEEAKSSGDSAKMSSALDDAAKYVDSISGHMNTCMTMMSKMHDMNGTGMMGGQMQQMDEGSTMKKENKGRNSQPAQ